MSTDAPEGYFTPVEVARLLDVSRARVRELADQGRLPHVMTRLGRMYEPGPVLALARAERRPGRPRKADRMVGGPP